MGIINGIVTETATVFPSGSMAILKFPALKLQVI
jgi:hypothetical protein